LARYVALLRGVNVGGRKVPMVDLRGVFEELGHTDVRTYIQSGNVVFDAKAGTPAKVRAVLERTIEDAFGFDVTVLLRTAADLGRTVKLNPYGTDAYVTFLDGVPDRKRVAELDPAPFAPDEFSVVGQVVYVRCPNGYGRTKINNTFFERKLALRATTRNWNTVETLLEWSKD
jgi:uncharacterized protein (DUF1697 family)